MSAGDRGRFVTFALDPMHVWIDGAWTVAQVEADAAARLGVDRDDPGVSVEWRATRYTREGDPTGNGHAVHAAWDPAGPPPADTVRLVCTVRHVHGGGDRAAVSGMPTEERSRP